VLFVVAYPTLMYVVIDRYRRTMARLRRRLDAEAALDFVVYLLIMWAVVALMTGEVTSVLLNLVLTQLVPVAAIRLFLTRGRHD
jgi:ACR3 family arsenite efflux pump ArsB